MIHSNLLQPAQTIAPFVEELGVHYGNGSLFDDRRWDKAGFDIYGDMYDDQPYLEFHVSLEQHKASSQDRTFIPEARHLFLEHFPGTRWVSRKTGKKDTPPIA